MHFKKYSTVATLSVVTLCILAIAVGAVTTGWFSRSVEVMAEASDSSAPSSESSEFIALPDTGKWYEMYWDLSRSESSQESADEESSGESSEASSGEFSAPPSSETIVTQEPEPVVPPAPPPVPDPPSSSSSNQPPSSGSSAGNPEPSTPTTQRKTATTTGYKMRQYLLGLQIRSSSFTYGPSGGNYVFTTRGYGHGVGMSQEGANLYAKIDGWGYRQILSHYYNNKVTYVSAPDDTLRVALGGIITSEPTNDILARIVAAEMDDSMADEALKAQAVATHTYIKYCNNHGQVPAVPTRTPSARIRALVDQVADELMYYGGAPIDSVYFAMSNGKTQSSAEIWGGSLPYLVGVPSVHENAKNLRNFEVTKAFPQSYIIERALDLYGIQLDPAHPEEWFAINSYTSGGYVGQVTVKGYVPG